MEKRPIIIDTDPGIDDAVALAIALFSEELDVKLITTVAGNVSLEKVDVYKRQASASSEQRFSPDCPPRLGSSASGRSFSII